MSRLTFIQVSTIPLFRSFSHHPHSPLIFPRPWSRSTLCRPLSQPAPCSLSPRRYTPKASLRHVFLAASAALTTLVHPPSIHPLAPTPQPSALSTIPLHQSTSLPSFRSRGLTLAVSSVPAVPKSNPLRIFIPKRIDGPYRYAAKILLLIGLSVFVITAITIAVFWTIQDSLVYKPTKVWRGTPAASGMPYYEDVNYCTVDGVEISGWFIKQPPESFGTARTLMYFHGTDKNASFRLKKVLGFYEKCRCNVLLLSYRGYGLSTGKPNERGVRIDAESAYDYLKSRDDVNVGPRGNLWVYGESLGGAVAVYFSNLHQHCINALILENTFTSLLDMIKLEFPILGIFRYLSRNRWQSKKRIGELGIPMLFLSGLKDTYIPPQMMKQMHSLAIKSPLKEFVEFESGTHNRTWTTEGFYETVAQFMDRVETEMQYHGTGSQNSLSSGGGLNDGNRLATAA